MAPLQTLDASLSVYWSAFWYLNQCRVYGPSGAPCGLPLTEKIAYMNEYAIVDREERRRFLRFLSALDATYILHYVKQIKKA